jgi:GxxExxY protein
VGFGTRVIVELKAVSRFDPIHEAMVMSYLRTTGFRLGLMMNFHAPTLKEGLKRIVL